MAAPPAPVRRPYPHRTDPVGPPGLGARHIALRGQAFTPGVVRGLECDLFESAGGLASARLALMQGQGLSVDGEDVRVLQALDVALADLPAVADPSVFAGMGAAGGGEGVSASKVVGPTLGAVVAADAEALPRVGILLLQPVGGRPHRRVRSHRPMLARGLRQRQRDRLRGLAHRRRGTTAVVRLARGVPEPAGDAARCPGRWRNDLAWRIFDAERMLGPDEILPWEAFGVPIGLVGCDPAWAPLFLDRASVVRRGTGALRAHGRRRGRPGYPLAAAGAVAGALRAIGRADRRGGRSRHPTRPPWLPTSRGCRHSACCPPCGRSRRHVEQLLPRSFTLTRAPLPTEQLDAALAEAASLAPLDLALGERVRLLVPVPQAVFEPRLLIHETIDPNSPPRWPPSCCSAPAHWAPARPAYPCRGAGAGDQRHAAGGARDCRRRRSARDRDAGALGTAARRWRPPPSLRAGVHQHFFEAATETMAVASGERLFAWVYLDPDNPPRSLMLQWHAGSWDHRAYWGENSSTGARRHRVARPCR